MADRPDYTKPIAFALQEVPSWGRKEWAAKAEELHKWTAVFGGSVHPMESVDIDFYTVPEGKKLYITNFNTETFFRGDTTLRIKDGPYICIHAQTVLDSKYSNFSIPFTVETGDTLRLQIENKDIIYGGAYGLILAWEQAASTPKKAKRDDPEERYKCGEFNEATVIKFITNEILILFRSYKEKKVNYLKIRNYREKREESISFHLREEDAREILRVLQRLRSERLSPFLSRVERKNKKYRKILV